MSQPPDHSDAPVPRDSPLTGWHYLLIFTSFGLVVLTVASSKYQVRQAQFEQRFQGIQEMQRHPGGAAANNSELKRSAEVSAGPVEAADQPLIVTLRPIMLILAVAMLVAWVAIQVRARRRNVQRPSTARHTRT